PSRGGARRGVAPLVPSVARAGRQARAARAVDGHERRLRGGDRGRRDHGAGRHRDLWSAPIPSDRPGRMSVKGKRVGFIGGGNMGEALIKGVLGASLVPPEMISATDVRTDRASQLTRQFRITAHGDNARCVRDADVVILAVTPQIMGQVLREIAPTVGPQHLLISIAAGVSTGTIRSGLGKDARIIRVMPNTPALVLQGATAIAKGKGLGPDDLGTAEEIFGAVGRVVVLDEELMDAVT